MSNAIKRARDARLNEVTRELNVLGAMAVEQRHKFEGWRMQRMRDTAENILQCVHEASAYDNAMRALS